MSKHPFLLRRVLPCTLAGLAATAVLAFGAQPAGDAGSLWGPRGMAASGAAPLAEPVGLAQAAGATSWDGRPAGFDEEAARRAPAAPSADRGLGTASGGRGPEREPQARAADGLRGRPDDKALMGALLLGIRQDPRSMSLMLR